MSITSGLTPVRRYANGGMSEEEQFKEAMRSQVIAKIEERLGIKIPRGSKESEDALINSIIGGATDLPISKRGDEITYGDNDGFSFYVNPEEEGAGVRYNKRFAQGGLAAYADGGSSFFNPFDKGELQRQNKLISERAKNRTPEETQAAFEALTPEEKARISDPYDVEGFNKSFKENIFDYKDPVDYATLPFLSLRAAKLAGKAGKKVYDTVRGSGGKLRENLRGIGAYVGADMLADEIRDDSDPFFTKQDDGTYVSTRPNIEDDALDQATEDLEDVNAEEKELTKKEKGIKALAAFAEAFGDSQSEYTGTPGFMIEGSGISTPEITRYQGGGIANMDPIMMADGGDGGMDFMKMLSSFGGKDEEDEEEEEGGLGAFLKALGDSGKEYSSTKGYTIQGMGAATPEIKRYEDGGMSTMDPMMMAGGGIAKFGVGKLVVKKGKEGIEKLKKYKDGKAKAKAKAKADKDKAAKAKAKAKAKADAKETGVTKDKPVDPRDSFMPTWGQPIASRAKEIARKIGTPTQYAPTTKQIIGNIGAATGVGGIAAGIYGLSQLGDKKPTAQELADAQALEDKADAEKAYKERQEAREGLTSMPDIIRARSLERAEAAGRSEPTFVDYIASFPASYSEKIGKDPEFAKQMMAGFAAMTKTTEGYAPRNAFTDFTQGVQEERIRQDEGMSDQLKLLKETQINPDIAQQLRNLNRPEIASTELSMLMSNVKRKVGDRLKVVLKDTDILVDPETNLTISDLDLAALYNSDGPEAVLELSNRLIYKEV